MSEYDKAQSNNIAAFGEVLDSLLQTDRGKFVVIQQAEVVGTFESLEGALRIGYERFGREPFLVQPIEPLPTRREDVQLSWPA